MSAEPKPEHLAAFLAEEVLRTIYGDDFKGCKVSPDQIAAVLQTSLQQQQTQLQELLSLYEKVIEAVHLLSTPPGNGNVTEPAALQALLSDRLDQIHSVTTKTMQTTAGLGNKNSDET